MLCQFCDSTSSQALFSTLLVSPFLIQLANRAMASLADVVTVHSGQIHEYFECLTHLGKRKRAEEADPPVALVDGETVLLTFVPEPDADLQTSDTPSLPVDCRVCGAYVYIRPPHACCLFCSSVSFRAVRFKAFVAPGCLVSVQAGVRQGPALQAHLVNGRALAYFCDAQQPLLQLEGHDGSSLMWQDIATSDSLACFCRLVAFEDALFVELDIRIAYNAQATVDGLADICYPAEPLERQVSAGHLRELYSSILPPHDDPAIEGMLEYVHHDRLLPTLLPYQKRAVLWCLRREGTTMSTSGTLAPFDSALYDGYGRPKHDFCYETVPHHTGLYMHRDTGALAHSPDTAILADESADVHGGILAEEMGYAPPQTLCHALQSASLTVSQPVN